MLEDFRDQISAVASVAATQIYSGLGRLAAYSSRSSAPFNVYAWAEDRNRIELQHLGNTVEDEKRVIFVPTQISPTGQQFPPALGLSNNDTIVFDNITYRIDNWKNPDGVNAAWKLNCKLAVPLARKAGITS
jgi:hypothetical protein